MNKDTQRQFLNIVATVFMLVVNGLANALPLNGHTTGSISDRFAVYFVPAGYVFSIWGVIYVLLLAYTVYQALPSQRQNEALRRIGLLPALSSILNGVWIFMWHYELFPLTLVVMAGLLLTLIAIYLRLGIGLAPANAAVRWCLHIPYSVYLGWITVATVANVTQLLFMLNWNGFGLGPVAWAVVMLAVGALITGAMILTRRDIAYTLVIVWAYAGIVVKQSATTAVAGTAAVVAVVALIAIVLVVARVIPRRVSPAIG